MAIPVAPSVSLPVTDAGKGSNHQLVKGPVPNYPPSHYNLVPVGQVLKGGTTGGSYSETISVQGGIAPYAFAVTSGSLPTGTSLNPSTGVISGTPSVAASFAFTITVTDTNGFIGSQGFTIVIAAPASGGAYAFVT